MNNNASLTVISETMIRSHLAVLTVGWFAKNNLPPTRLEAYDGLIKEMKVLLIEKEDLPWFLLGLEFILLNPDPAVARNYVNDCYAYTNEAARRLLLYLLSGLSPGKAPDPKGPAVALSLVQMTRQEWVLLRRRLAQKK